MEIHLNEAEILRILLDHVNSLTPELYEFSEARISRYPVLSVILSMKDEDAAQ
jgi:hypothetical protein